MSVELAVLMPVYQNAEGVAQSLRSLREAMWPMPGAVVIADDGSDPPLDIRAGDWAPLTIMVVRLPQNGGVEAALNAGLERALSERARYIARLDAGDTIDPQRLARQVRVLESDPGIGIVGSDVDFEDEQGRRLFRFVGARTDAEIRKAMHIGLCLIDPAVTVRAALFESVGRYSRDYPAAEGYDLAFRFLAVSKGACIPEALTRTTLEKKGLSLTRRRDQLKSRLRLQLRYFDVREFRSFAGVCVTLLLFVIPRVAILRVKQLFSHSRY